jgi:hypothetical protein
VPTRPTTYANQSVALADVLDAFALLLRKATGLKERSVVEYYGDGRPAVEADGHLVWFRWLQEDPDEESGAGRHGTKNEALVEVNLTTRGFKDGAARDRKLGRDHLARRSLIANALYGQILFDAYGDPQGAEPPKPPQDAAVLTIATMTAAKLPKPDRPRPEQGYIESRIGVRVPCVLRLTLDPVPDMEGRVFPDDA